MTIKENFLNVEFNFHVRLSFYFQQNGKKTHTDGTFLKSNKKIRRNRGKMDTINTQIHDHSFSWLVQALE
jgi:hypothetical protein